MDVLPRGHTGKISVIDYPDDLSIRIPPGPLQYNLHPLGSLQGDHHHIIGVVEVPVAIQRVE